MPPIWMGFLAQNSPNKDLFFGRFSLDMGGFGRISQKKQLKMDSLPPKCIIKWVRMQVLVAERGYLSSGRPTSIQKSSTPTPPREESIDFINSGKTDKHYIIYLKLVM